MRVVVEDAGGLARAAAAEVAAELRAAVDARGSATLAVSGGSTPGDLLEALAGERLPWEALDVFQVDERVAPDGHPDRNLELLRTRLLDRGVINAEQVHPMPVGEPDLTRAAASYEATVRASAGDPPVFDVVQLGLGSDGHTASLLPGDPADAVMDRDVAVSGPYAGRRRLTLTHPVLARARSLVWLVRGGDKRDAVAKLVAADASIPAGRVPQARAVLFVDTAAAPPALEQRSGAAPKTTG